MIKIITQKLTDAWPAPFVARSEVHKFSGGLVSPKTLANADSKGVGPEGLMRFGKKKVAYPTKSLAYWIAKRYAGSK